MIRALIFSLALVAPLSAMADEKLTEAEAATMDALQARAEAAAAKYEAAKAQLLLKYHVTDGDTVDLASRKITRAKAPEKTAKK